MQDPTHPPILSLPPSRGSACQTNHSALFGVVGSIYIYIVYIYKYNLYA